MNILIVDDQPELCTLLGHLMRRLGHETIVETDPVRALEILGTESVDALISDIHMPQMTGVGLARQVRQGAPRMPIVFCTGSSPEEELVEEAASIGPVLPKVSTRKAAIELIGMLNLQASAPLEEAPGWQPCCSWCEDRGCNWCRE